MPDSMSTADTAGILKVIGSSMAMVVSGPRPGRMPTTVPSVAPMTQYSRFAGVSATWKPAMMLPRMCISVAASSRQQVARRQPQPIDEDAARDGAEREYGQHDFDGAKARAGSTGAQDELQHR